MDNVNEILIVKTSSIGDVVQTFIALEYLKEKFPQAKIDWVVEKNIADLLEAHPLLDQVLVIDTKKWRKNIFSKVSILEIKSFITRLRKKKYDLLFDFQGNIKSSFVDMFAIASKKIGFSKECVPEKINLLFTHLKVDVSSQKNIYQRYLLLPKKFLNDQSQFIYKGRKLTLNLRDLAKIEDILNAKPIKDRVLFMVCLGSNWENKKLSEHQVPIFLDMIYKELSLGFVFVYGSKKEEMFVEEMSKKFKDHSICIGNMSLPFWQNVMGEVQGVICVDSSALHLAASINCPTFAVFGPSAQNVYNPQGSLNFFIQGNCPYKEKFDKRCKKLRSCKTGACIKEISAHELYKRFISFYNHLQVVKGL